MSRIYSVKPVIRTDEFTVVEISLVTITVIAFSNSISRSGKFDTMLPLVFIHLC